MTVRRGEGRGSGADALAYGGSPTENLGHSTGIMTREERLDYIAEMVGELKVMAARAGCRTLTGLLDLAAEEARLRWRE